MNEINQIVHKNSASWRSPHNLAMATLAVISGLFIGWLDLHVTEVVVTILALFVVGLMLGLLQPAAAWRWAILIAIGLPIIAEVARVIGLHTAEPARLDVRVALVALVFALLGSYVGVFIRYFVRALTSRSS